MTTGAEDTRVSGVTCPDRGQASSGGLPLDKLTDRLLASSSECIKLLSPDGRMLFMSDGGQCAMEVDDFDRELRGADWVSMWQPGDQPRVSEAIAAAVAGGTGRFQAFCKTMKGTPRWWDVTVTSISGDKGVPESLLCISRDITALKKVEERLRESETELRAVLDNLPVCVKVVSPEGRLIDMNPAGQAMLQVASLDDLIGACVAELVEPDDRPAFNAAHQAALAGRPMSEPVRFGIRAADGTRRQLSTRAVPLRDADGQVSAVLAVTSDVTAEEASVERLRASEALARDRLAELEQIYLYAPVGLFTFDRSYRFTRINQRMAEINGFAVEEHAGKSMWDIVPDLADHLVEVYRPVMERGEALINIELQGETPAAPGVRRDWLASYFPLRSASGEIEGLIGAVLEVTERKRAEARLADSEELLAQAVNVAKLGIFDHDHQAAKVIWSSALREMLGLEPDEPVSRQLYGTLVHPDDLEGLRAAVAKALDPAGDGRCFVEHRIVRRSGEVRWLSLSSQTFFARVGSSFAATRTVGAINDITERRQAAEDLRVAQENLMRVSRLSAMGAMASTLAHELNQPLTAAANYFAVIRRLAENPSSLDARSVLMAVDEGAAETLRAGEIIRRIRRFAVDGRVKPQPENVVTVINAAWKETQVLPAAEGVELSWDPNHPAVLVEIEPLQIEQVLVNLFRNAVEAMSGQVSRRITVSLRRTPETVELSVVDTGPGIPPNLLADLFTPFRTTKAGGMGLGLPLCRTIVEAHGGHIRAEQARTGGAAFVITLPVAHG